MDFIELPASAKPHILVQDLGGPEYDGELFEDYPDRCGWDLEEIVDRGLLYIESQNSSAAVPIGQFLQTWLFFGAMAVVLGRKIPRRDYSVEVVIGSGTGKVLTTKSLLAELEGRLGELADDTAAEGPHLACLEKTHQALLFALLFLDRFELRQSEIAHLLMPIEAWLQISIHIEILLRVVDPSRISRSSLVADNMFDFGPILEYHGWCSSEVSRLKPVDNAGLYYLSQLNFPKRHFQGSHEDCEANICFAMNIDVATYATRHTTVECSCPMIMCNQESVTKILEQGCIPILQFEYASATLLIQISENSRSTYVTISHVWSDGLGNPTQNALPTCQLQRLQSWVDELVPPEEGQHTAFWIDTLLIPLQNDRLRARAINLIHSTFANAKAVLVLDHDLYSIPRPPHAEETLFRLIRSTWITRLWTYKEAAVATRLYVRFKDSCVDLYQLDHEIWNQTVMLPHFHPLLPAYLNLCHCLRSLLNVQHRATQPDTCAIAEVWIGLDGRTTSRLTDAAVCVLGLIQEDVSPVIEADNQQMQRFWQAVPSVPTSVLWNRGTKMKEAGFRWAPASLIEPATLKSGVRTNGRPLATPTPKGLQVSGMPGYVLHDLHVPADTTRLVPFVFYDCSADTSFTLWKGDKRSFEPWSKDGLHLHQAVILLMESQPRQTKMKGILAAVESNPTNQSPADEVLRYLTCVFVDPRPLDEIVGLQQFKINSDGQFWSNGEILHADSEKAACLGQTWGTSIEEDRRWLIT